jgi:hypothetical protein
LLAVRNVASGVRSAVSAAFNRGEQYWRGLSGGISNAASGALSAVVGGLTTRRAILFAIAVEELNDARLCSVCWRRRF